MSLTGVERPLPPPPRLQNYPFQDIKELRRNDKPLLDSYEWIDRSAGTVRIPVDRAMDLLAERGLPYRKPGQPSAAPPPPAPGAQPPGAAADRRVSRRVGGLQRCADADGQFEWAAANDGKSAEAEAVTVGSGLQTPGRVWLPATTM